MGPGSLAIHRVTAAAVLAQPLSNSWSSYRRRRVRPGNAPLRRYASGTVDYPIFITCRDRLTPLLRLVSWLEKSGAQRICLVDNASTYEPLLEYYERCPHVVVRLPENLGQLSPWLSNTINTHALGENYVVTDPDVVPDSACPRDAVDHFRRVLDRFPDISKVGFGLRIDDLPRRYQLRRQVQAWESQFWCDKAAPGLYRAPIDTTFALYREHTPATMGPALRTGWPYVARHLPWYADSAHPDQEEQYYMAHARSDVTSWQGAALPAWLAAWLNGDETPDVLQRRPAGAEAGGRTSGEADDELAFRGRRRQMVLAARGRRLSRRRYVWRAWHGRAVARIPRLVHQR